MDPWTQRNHVTSNAYTHLTIPPVLHHRGINLPPVERHLALALLLRFAQPRAQIREVESAVGVVAAEFLEFGVQEEGDFWAGECGAEAECCGLDLLG